MLNKCIFKDGRVLVHGTNDTVKAKSYYAKYMGPNSGLKEAFVKYRMNT